MNIFIGNLNTQTTEKQLRDLFVTYGTVTSVKIITDQFTRRPKGFAFVEMPAREEANKAIEKLNSSYLNARSLVVNEAKPKTGSDSRERRY